MSKARQSLIGCALGCGALILLSVGSCISLVVWLNRPGDVLEPERLLSADTTGYIEWTLRLEDPGTRDFFELMLAKLQRMNDEMPAVLPTAVGGPLRRMKQRSDEKKLRRMFPIVLAWTVEPRASQEDNHVLSASLRGLDHQLLLADWLIGIFLERGEENRVVRYHGEKIYLIEIQDDKDPLPVFIHRGDLFFTSSEDNAERAIDRLQDPIVIAAGSSLEPWLARAPAGSLRGAVSNQRGEVWRTWASFLDEDILEKVSLDLRRALDGVTIGGNFTAEGSLEARVTFQFHETNDAVRGQISIRDALADVIDETPIEIERSEVDGTSLRFELEVRDFGGKAQPERDREPAP